MLKGCFYAMRGSFSAKFTSFYNNFVVDLEQVCPYSKFARIAVNHIL